MIHCSMDHPSIQQSLEGTFQRWHNVEAAVAKAQVENVALALVPGCGAQPPHKPHHGISTPSVIQKHTPTANPNSKVI